MKEKLINFLAKEVAENRRKADVERYVNERCLASWAYETGASAQYGSLMKEFGIEDEVKQASLKIYDYSNSGKEGYTLKDGKIVPIDPVEFLQKRVKDLEDEVEQLKSNKHHRINHPFYPQCSDTTCCL